MKTEIMASANEKTRAIVAEILEMFKDSNKMAEIFAIAATRQENKEGWLFPSQKYLGGFNNFVAYHFSKYHLVGTFNQFKELGFTLKNGQTSGIVISVPVTRRFFKVEKDENTGEEKKVAHSYVGGYIWKSVFAVEQFLDKDGQEFNPEKYFAPLPTNGTPLVKLAEKLGVTVTAEFADYLKSYKGYFRPSENKIAVCGLIGGNFDTKVFFHEMAHKIHQIVKEKRGEKMVLGQDPGQEICAEFCALALMKIFNLEANEKSVADTYDYLKHYAMKSKQSLENAMYEILGDVKKILDIAIESEEKEQEQSE